MGINCLAEQLLVGVGSDGAANMIGKESGLAAKIKKKCNKYYFDALYCLQIKFECSKLDKKYQLS